LPMSSDREKDIVDAMERLAQESQRLVKRHREVLEEFERLREELQRIRAEGHKHVKE